MLTASGGPFRGRTAGELADVTVEQALAHPTWSMGPKITIDSSTLMNKGLEVIEAHELFGVAYDQIEVVVHPQSIVHSMVEFTDGSTIAQLSMPDMRLPIGYALAYPARIATPFGRIDWAQVGPARLRARPTRRRSAAWPWPTTPAAPAARRRPGSAPPTRWPSRRSSPDACAGRRSPRSPRPSSIATTDRRHTPSRTSSTPMPPPAGWRTRSCRENSSHERANRCHGAFRSLAHHGRRAHDRGDGAPMSDTYTKFRNEVMAGGASDQPGQESTAGGLKAWLALAVIVGLLVAARPVEHLGVRLRRRPAGVHLPARARPLPHGAAPRG